MLRLNPKNLFIFAVPILLLAITSATLAQPSISSQERQVEEVRIQKDIETKLDWRNRTKETLDDYDDTHRLLYSSLNESILLRQASGERFGVFESLRDNGRKSIEIRLHKKNKLSDRFFFIWR